MRQVTVRTCPIFRVVVRPARPKPKQPNASGQRSRFTSTACVKTATRSHNQPQPRPWLKWRLDHTAATRPSRPHKTMVSPRWNDYARSSFTTVGRYIPRVGQLGVLNGETAYQRRIQVVRVHGISVIV